jgi:hypothetical protein
LNIEHRTSNAKIKIEAEAEEEKEKEGAAVKAEGGTLNIEH